MGFFIMHVRGDRRALVHLFFDKAVWAYFRQKHVAQNRALKNFLISRQKV